MSYFKHGLAMKGKRHRLYSVWASMKSRCCNPNDPGFHKYGGRGIKLSDPWMEFINFYNDMGPSHVEGLSIDRVDNNGPYSKENCRWATIDEQANNTRSNRRIEYNGASKTVSQWAKCFGIPRQALTHRLNRGWSIDRAFKHPVQKRIKC